MVGKFAGNIYTQEYFKDSVYFDYLNAFWVGYSMSNYNYANACLENSTSFLNVFHTWYLTSTYRRSYTELWDLFFVTTGTSFNDAWYKCFLYYDDISYTYKTKWENFNDFGDIYLSFIFNMLSPSLNIKMQTENMIDAYAAH